jgi:hypothetical protein
MVLVRCLRATSLPILDSPIWIMPLPRVAPNGPSRRALADFIAAIGPDGEAKRVRGFRFGDARRVARVPQPPAECAVELIRALRVGLARAAAVA